MLTFAFRDHIFGFKFPEIEILVGFQICVALSGDLVGVHILCSCIYFLHFCVFLYFSDLCRPESGEEARAAHRGWAPLLKASAAAASPLKQAMEN